MLGHIESYSEDIQTGVIKSGKQYFEFHIDKWVSEAQPEVGDDVEFHIVGDDVQKVSLIGDYMHAKEAAKSRLVAGILGLLLGGLGVHRIYLGFYGIAIMQIALTIITSGFGLMWGFIEGFLILGSYIYKDAKGRLLK